MVQSSEIKATVKSYILDEFLPGEDATQLEDTTPLITGGILDSISTFKLVTFLEGQFGVEFQAHEMSPDNLDTLSSIARTIESKQR